MCAIDFWNCTRGQLRLVTGLKYYFQHGGSTECISFTSRNASFLSTVGDTFVPQTRNIETVETKMKLFQVKPVIFFNPL